MIYFLAALCALSGDSLRPTKIYSTVALSKVDSLCQNAFIVLQQLLRTGSLRQQVLAAQDQTRLLRCRGASASQTL